jgi:hypothetical protein
VSNPPPTSKKFRGRHKFVCDVDGQVYYSEHKRVRWDGAVVHVSNMEQRHPQDQIKAIPELNALIDIQVEPGIDSDQAAGYDYTFDAGAPTFALVDEFGTFVVSEDVIYIQAPTTAGTLS